MLTEDLQCVRKIRSQVYVATLDSLFADLAGRLLFCVFYLRLAGGGICSRRPGASQRHKSRLVVAQGGQALP